MRKMKRLVNPEMTNAQEHDTMYVGGADVSLLISDVIHPSTVLVVPYNFFDCSHVCGNALDRLVCFVYCPWNHLTRAWSFLGTSFPKVQSLDLWIPTSTFISAAQKLRCG